MTRRHLLVGMFLPALGIPTSDGFVVSGDLQSENEPGYYSINGAETVSLMLSPELAPSMVRAADALVGKPVEFVLRRKL